MTKNVVALCALVFCSCACVPSPGAAPSPTERTVAPATALPVAPSATAVTPTVVAAIATVPHVEPTETLPSATPVAMPEYTPVPSPAVRIYVYPVRSDDCTVSSSHHDYPAADIFCPIGVAFVAVTDGVVDFVSYEDRWSPSTDDPALRGGIAVAIIGDDGVRYYGSHLSGIARGIEPGMRVTAGQVLGFTGASGNARGTPPHLHFGISRPTTPDDWKVRRGEVWPQPYLSAWQRGEYVTPQLRIAATPSSAVSSCSLVNSQSRFKFRVFPS